MGQRQIMHPDPDSAPHPVAEILTTKLLPFEDQALKELTDVSGVDSWRFVDAPPAVMNEVLAAVDESFAHSRPNEQPPAGWLVQVAEEVGGRLCGAVLPSREALRVDAICVLGEAVDRVFELLERDWPGQAEVALVEGWNDWDATSSEWELSGGDFLISPPPPCTVYSVWWD